jgi:hypothetical protein
MDSQKSTITLTFGDQAENHVGMQQMGERVAEGQGFQYEDIEAIYSRLEALGATVERYDLHENDPEWDLPPAYLLVIRNAVSFFLPEEKDANESCFQEQAALPVDKKAYMYGRVVQKHARWNLCFDHQSQDPDYAKGRGRVISFNDVPLTHRIMEQFPVYFGEKARDLKGEGNYYYDTRTCGIGYHGDSERRKVIALRLGAPLSICYQWYRHGNPVGYTMEIPLNGGDMYLMSEKAVGTDWKKPTIYTLRHATGAKKFTDVK